MSRNVLARTECYVCRPYENGQTHKYLWLPPAQLVQTFGKKRPRPPSPPVPSSSTPFSSISPYSASPFDTHNNNYKQQQKDATTEAKEESSNHPTFAYLYINQNFRGLQELVVVPKRHVNEFRHMQQGQKQQQPQSSSSSSSSASSTSSSSASSTSSAAAAATAAATFREEDIGFWRELGILLKLLLNYGAQDLTLEISYGDWIVHRSDSPHYHAHIHVRFSNYRSVLQRLMSQLQAYKDVSVVNWINDKEKKVYEGDVTVPVPVYQSLHFLDFCTSVCTNPQLQLFVMTSGWFRSISGFVLRIAIISTHETQYSIRCRQEDEDTLLDLLKRQPKLISQAFYTYKREKEKMNEQVKGMLNRIK